jgi:hypothetical protein
VREQLADGWKAWPAERGLQSAGPQGAGGAVKPGRSHKAGICNKYAKIRTEYAIICQKYAHEFRKYAKNMQIICTKYALNMEKICKHMQRICT